MQILKKQHRLSRRIIVAFVVMAAVISALFSVGVIVAVRVLEKHLLSDSLHGDLAVTLARYNAGRDLELQPGSRFYHEVEGSSNNLDEPPKWLDNLDSGFHEVFREGQSFHALVYQQGNEKFLYLRDQTDFEKREQVLFLVVAAGFILSLVAAWILGYFLARRIMLPVARLANQVSHRSQLLTLAPALAPDYADDEVGQLAAAFDGTLDQLRQALERERFFTSDVSHELRTPLTVIANSCELLQAADSLNPKQKSQLQRVQRASQEMRELIHTFLQLARDNLDNENATGKTTIVAMAQEQLQQWQSVAESKDLQLLLVEESVSPDTHYNIALLRAVVSNLLRNAVHYTDSGYVRLVLTSRGFRVEDSGADIEASQREAIFQPFVRGSGARGEGLGLGLSLVKRICVHQGWQIRLYSQPTGGNCFEVSLI
ncbi:MAG TPA: HAMP domain-containing sensor histidine kinase [Pseudomonadales bacterium]|nr:HAMP domain-containing sensor histidine kinase [Pseudomonadales bacterium]